MLLAANGPTPACSGYMALGRINFKFVHAVTGGALVVLFLIIAVVYSHQTQNQLDNHPE